MKFTKNTMSSIEPMQLAKTEARDGALRTLLPGASAGAKEHWELGNVHTAGGANKHADSTASAEPGGWFVLRRPLQEFGQRPRWLQTSPLTHRGAAGILSA